MDIRLERLVVEFGTSEKIIQKSQKANEKQLRKIDNS